MTVLMFAIIKVVCSALLDYFGHALGANLTPSCAAAWKKFLDGLCVAVAQEMEEADGK